MNEFNFISFLFVVVVVVVVAFQSFLILIQKKRNKRGIEKEEAKIKAGQYLAGEGYIQDQYERLAGWLTPRFAQSRESEGVAAEELREPEPEEAVPKDCTQLWPRLNRTEEAATIRLSRLLLLHLQVEGFLAQAEEPLR